ncbi:MAG: hypothetical protein HC830_06250 [Bacteroidetes bacterium]|nr:hypothetical protein [Bacteroidota bacterium]
MKTYTQSELDQFFNHFKELPNSFTIEKVHQLINNPDVKARHTGHSFNLLKFIIMSSAFISIITVVALWFGLNEENHKLATKHLTPLTGNYKNQPEKTTVKTIKSKAIVTHSSERNTRKNEVSPLLPQPIINMQKNENQELIVSNNFPLDGEKFIISLTDTELEKLGFFIDETGIYYKNIYQENPRYFHARTENGNGELTHILPFLNENNKKSQASGFDFFPVTISNLTYTAYDQTEAVFVQMNDTLLPVKIDRKQLKYGDEDILVWFKTSETMFNLLPERYTWLKHEYSKIITRKSIEKTAI